MGVLLHFLGTGSSGARGVLSEGGFLIQTGKSTVAVDPGPGAALGLASLKVGEVDCVVVTSEERGHDSSLIKVKKGAKFDIEVLRKDGGVVFRLPDGVVSYVFGKVGEPKEFSCDVLVLWGFVDEKLLALVKPKLAILTGFDASVKENSPVYVARDLQKNTGIQTISAEDGLAVDLSSYGAVSEQKSLNKFREE